VTEVTVGAVMGPYHPDQVMRGKTMTIIDALLGAVSPAKLYRQKEATKTLKSLFAIECHFRSQMLYPPELRCR
jgi:hypothetical protein